MNDTDTRQKPQHKAISRLPAAQRLTAAGVAAASAVQKPPRDRALVLAELLAVANSDPALRDRLATYLADDTEGGVA